MSNGPEPRLEERLRMGLPRRIHVEKKQGCILRLASDARSV